MGRPIAATAEVISTSDVSPRQAFEQWEAIVADTVVPATVAPLAQGHWHGQLTCTQFERSSVTLMRASAQRVIRSRKQVDQSTDEFFLANFVVDGVNWTEQQGRRAQTDTGSIAFFDSGRPLVSLTTDNALSVIVRAPMDQLLEHSGLTRDELPIATAMPTDGALGVVTGFFRGLAELPPGESDRAANVLGTQCVEMLASAVLLATGGNTAAPTDSIFTRRQVLAYLRRRFTDPDLTMDEVAHACLVSRRTLYRVCAGFGGPAALVRRMRIEHARKLLRADPSRPLSAIAFASGFGTERHFYRAFRDETGMTPGEFRTGLGPDS
ncbi:AraC family transcriptional regulator [Nocardia otitidiscaviarum]|uniref:AraC family transcriptional regulator n=1 Tax=Nocardia otitidiscaviarum TaxID=1823 RepID=UPI001895A07C|nr:AraC family transcriptional regulator [Nocardia otitidiscaviarum]MBF6235733.1 AraC family transcriptional regulator [Nocardia otitidiscaviarum]